MIRHCNGTDPNLIDEQGFRNANCGRTFDDVSCIVICPHPSFDKTNIGNLIEVSRQEFERMAAAKPAPFRDMSRVLTQIHTTGQDNPVPGDPEYDINTEAPFGPVSTVQLADPWSPDPGPAGDLFEISLRLAGSYEFDTGRSRHGSGAEVVRPLLYCTRHPHGEHWTWATDMRATLEWIEAHEQDEHGTADLVDEWAPHHHHPLSSDPCVEQHATPLAERHMYGVMSLEDVPAVPFVPDALFRMVWLDDLTVAQDLAAEREGMVVALPIVADYRPRPLPARDILVRDEESASEQLVDDEPPAAAPQPDEPVDAPRLSVVGRAAVRNQQPRFLTARNGYFPSPDWRVVAVRGGSAPRWTNDPATDDEIARRAKLLNSGETLFMRRERVAA